MYRVRVLAVLLAAVFLTSCSSAGAKAADIPKDGSLSADISPISAAREADADGYILAASNSDYSLYYEETGLTVKVKNNSTGAVMTSAAQPDEDSSEAWKNFVNSGIVLEYYKGSATNLNKINMYSGSPSTEISLIENGFAAKITFSSIGISLKMFVTLDGDGIRVQVPESSIKEENEQYRLAAIYVLPFLGYTRLGETDGYMLIPDGSGALIELRDNNEKFSQPYKAKVYGGNYSVEADTAAVQKYDDTVATTVDAAGVFAPVFGMVHTSQQNAFLGIIEEGKYNAEIYAYPNGVITEYNWITARYVYREVYQYLTGQTSSITSVQETRETFDISVYYRFCAGDDADYTGLAKSYRQYLLEKGMLAKGDTDYSMRLDFFAGDEEEALLGKSFVSMTTVEQLDEILSDILSLGADSLTVSLKGWQKGGIYGNLNGKTSFQSDIGSFKDYLQLAKKYSDNAEFMLYGDFLNTYTKSGSDDYIYQYNGRVFSEDTFLKLNPTKYRYTASASVEHINALAAGLKEYKNIGISLDGVTDEVYSYASGEKRKMYSRNYSADTTAQALSSVTEAMTTAYNSPNDYLWADMQRYYDYRIYGSDYKFVSAEVPFFAIVLGGSVPLYSEYINFKADTTEYKLKLIESGVYPSFLLTYESPSELIYTDSSSLFSCEYTEYKEMIAEYNVIFSELAEAVDGSMIEAHSLLDGVSVTLYENGTAVVVNYNGQDAEYGGNTVAAQSYLILDGKAVR